MPARAPLAIALWLLPAIAWASETADPAMPKSMVSRVARLYTAVIDPLWPILAAFPTIPGEFLRASAAILRDGGLRTAASAGLFALLCILIVRLFAQRTRRVAPPSASEARLSYLLWRLARLILLVLAFVIVGIAVFDLAFRGASLRNALGIALVDLTFRLLTAIIAPLLLFRPSEPALRLVQASDAQVRAAQPAFMVMLVVGFAFPTLIPVWLEAGMSWPAAQGLALVAGAITAGAGYRAVARFCAPEPELWPRWRLPARFAALGFWLIWCYGVVALDFPFYAAIVATGWIIVAAVLFNRLFATCGRLAAEGDGRSNQFWRAYSGALGRIAFVLMGAGLVMVLGNWLFEIRPGWLSLPNEGMFETGLPRAVVIFCLGYIAFETLSSWSRARFAPPVIVAIPGSGDDEAALAPASRISTILPLVNFMLAVVILGSSALLALARLGVDTTPLLAGAGIFGLALSFGSQALVRDIVSGLFYMADDAFRIGEYIEAGKLKGSVERISLRSVRLRHQNGQVHTIPFGQLGSVTNYSRDYVTMKFNLRLARDVDLERVRKTVKKIGQDFLEDPEFGREFLQPLKMQGVADIEENALVVRFKFTVRPGRPTYVQREAIKRMLNAFAEKEIRFASHTVVIQNSGAGDDEDDTEAMKRAVAEASTRVPRLPPATTG